MSNMEQPEPLRSDSFSLVPGVTVATEKKRILVVDDQVSDTRIVKLLLESTSDYAVREENHAKAAISAACFFNNLRRSAFSYSNLLNAFR